MSIKFLENIMLARVRKMIRAHVLPNRILLKTSIELDFPIERVRKNLLGLNEIELKDISEQYGISRPILSNTLTGKVKTHIRSQQAIADSLGLTVAELFPPLDEAA